MLSNRCRWTLLAEPPPIYADLASLLLKKANCIWLWSTSTEHKDFVANHGANVSEKTILQCRNSTGISREREIFDVSNDVAPESVCCRLCYFCFSIVTAQFIFTFHKNSTRPLHLLSYIVNYIHLDMHAWGITAHIT